MSKRDTKHDMAAKLIAGALATTMALLPLFADARGFGGGGRGFAGGRSAPMSINRPGGDFGRPEGSSAAATPTSAIHNTNINVDRSYNSYSGPGYYGGGYHPIATGVAVGVAAGVTAAAIGSLAYSLPPSCTPYTYGGPYYQCGNVWYQPQYQGSSVTYVVVNPPR